MGRATYGPATGAPPLRKMPRTRRRQAWDDGAAAFRTGHSCARREQRAAPAEGDVRDARQGRRGPGQETPRPPAAHLRAPAPRCGRRTPELRPVTSLVGRSVYPFGTGEGGRRVVAQPRPPTRTERSPPGRFPRVWTPAKFGNLGQARESRSVGISPLPLWVGLKNPRSGVPSETAGPSPLRDGGQGRPPPPLGGASVAPIAKRSQDRKESVGGVG